MFLKGESFGEGVRVFIIFHCVKTVLRLVGGEVTKWHSRNLVLNLTTLHLNGSLSTYRRTQRYCYVNSLRRNQEPAIAALLLLHSSSFFSAVPSFPLPRGKHKRRLYMWISPYGQYQNQIDYILCSQRWRSSIQSAKTRLGADCGSDHELLLAKFRLKLKKVQKTTRPFRYDLNQIHYDYTVEVRNKI